MDLDELGALLARSSRRVIDAERTRLDVHGLSMWQYIVLARLGDGPAPTQLALAGQVGYDKTRLIALLDALAARGLVTREPDPGDRRARIVMLTDSGSAVLAAARRDIRAMQDDLLAELAPERRAELWCVLSALADPARRPR